MISQGSVATYLRCDGIFHDSTITNFFLIQSEEKFENWSAFDRDIRRTKMWQCAYEHMRHAFGSGLDRQPPGKN